MRIEFVGVFIFLLGSLIYTLLKSSKEKQIKKYAAFSSGRTGTGLRLPDYLRNVQNELNLSKEFKIFGETEWQYAEEIIKRYQNYILDKYFDSTLYVPKSKYILTDTDIFMFKFQSYLDSHLKESFFGEYEMHEKTLKHSGEYFSCSDTTYLLSDFAVVMAKLYYISFSYCKQSRTLHNHLNPFIKLSDIESVITTKELTISHR